MDPKGHFIFFANHIYRMLYIYLNLWSREVSNIPTGIFAPSNIPTGALPDFERHFVGQDATLAVPKQSRVVML